MIKELDNVDEEQLLFSMFRTCCRLICARHEISVLSFLYPQIWVTVTHGLFIGVTSETSMCLQMK